MRLSTTFIIIIIISLYAVSEDIMIAVDWVHSVPFKKVPNS